MTTGNFWNVANPDKPFGIFDPDGVYDIPFDWASWLAGLAGGADSYNSHSIIAQTGLSVVLSSQALGIITVRIAKDPVNPLVAGQKYWVTCRIVTTNGQREDQTVYLKIKDK